MRISILLVCLIWCWSHPAAGARRTATPEQPAPRFRHYTSKDGLSQSDVSAILQDPDGYMWFATADGLNRFDGQTFTVFRHVPATRGSLAERSLSSLHLSPADPAVMWVGTTGGSLYRLDRTSGHFTLFDHAHDYGPFSRSGNWIQAILQHPDAPGILWVGSTDGLHRIDPATGHCTRFRHDPADPHSLSSNSVTALYAGPQGSLWIGTNAGLDRLDVATGRTERRAGLTLQITDFYASPHAPGTLWMGTKDGLVHFDLHTGSSRHYLSDRDTPLEVSGMAADPGTPEVLWVATRAGLVRLDTQTGRAETYRHVPGDPGSLHGDDLHGIYADRTGILWISVRGRGVDRFDPADGFRHLRHVPGNPQTLPDPSVFALYKDREGRLWTGTRNAGLSRFDPATGAVKHWRHEPGRPHSLSSNHVRTIYEDHAGTLWIGTDDGLNRMDGPDRFTRFGPVPGDTTSLSSGAIRDLYESPSAPGVLWVATAGGGLNRFDTRTGRTRRFVRDQQNPKSLAHNWLWSLLEDHAGTLWIGLSSQGLCRMTGEAAFACVGHDPGDPGSLSNDKVFAIHERAREPGVLWIGTNGGLNRFDTRTGHATHFTEADGLANSVIYALLEDEEGHLWMSTNRGLSRYDPASHTFHNFDLDSGIQSLEFNAAAAFRSADGEMFFGGTNGLTAFYPQHVHDNPFPPQVALTDVKLFNRSVAERARAAGQDPLSLRHDENMITFDFVGLHFKNPARITYLYRLDGVDKAWAQAGRQQTATYAGLRPGTYTFVVRAANADGVWSDDQRLLRLVVHPPPWRTWWAYLLYVASLAGGVVAYVQWRTRRLRHRQAEIARLLEQRTRDLQVEKRNVEEALAEARRAQEVIAAQADRLQQLDEVKSRFFANISHEFRTPLTLILGPLQLLLGGSYGPVDPPVQEQLGLIQGNAQRLLRLINQILDLARADVGEWRPRKQPQDLVAFVRRHVRRFAPLAELEGVTLALETDAEAPCTASFDPAHLEEVLENLLSNAFKFTPRGGTVTVSTAATEAWCTLTVADTGVGIDAEALPHVFDRFYQADNVAEDRPAGTGLGLFLVRRLVELHDGVIDVDSTPGAGTVFTIRLPLHASGDGAAVPVGHDEQSVGTTTPSPPLLPSPDEDADAEADEDRTTVLVVEDHANMRAYVRTVLSRDFRVLEAADGREGLACARETLPDLIVADVMMPNMDGFELARALRDDPATDCIPIVLLTALATSEDQLEGLALHVDDYVTKPFSAPVLRARVHNLIALRQHLRDRYRQGHTADTPVAGTAPTETVLAQQVRHAVTARLSDASLTVEELAKTVALSPSQLNRRLNDEVGCPANAFIRQVRLEHAAGLLTRGAGSIAEVAYAVGFNSLSYFARRFREHTGVSPSEYAPAPQRAGQRDA